MIGVASALLEFEAPFLNPKKTGWLISSGRGAAFWTMEIWWKNKGAEGSEKQHFVDPYVSVHTGLRHNFDSRHYAGLNSRAFLLQGSWNTNRSPWRPSDSRFLQHLCQRI